MRYYEILKENIEENISEIVVSAERYEWYVLDILAKLNKKTKKLGFPPITVTIVSKETKMVPLRTWSGKLPGEKREVPKEFYKLKVNGVAPHIAGYELIGVIDFSAGEGIVLSVPGKVMPPQFRNAKDNCDHCHVNRRRNKVYVLKEIKTGQYIQVGASCLQDFFQGQDPSHVIQMANIYEILANSLDQAPGEDDDGDHPRVRRGSPSLLLTTYMSYVCAIANKFGFVSAAAAKQSEGKMSTAESALHEIYSKEKDRITPTLADHEEGKKILEWARKFINDSTNLSDYENNLRIILKNDSFETKFKGFVASLYSLYKKEFEKQVRVKHTSENSVSEYVGTIGERSKMTVTVVATKKIETMYGVSTLYRMKDASGNEINWFSTAKIDMQVGSTYNVAAMIDKHQEYNGVKTTYVKRLKLEK